MNDYIDPREKHRVFGESKVPHLQNTVASDPLAEGIEVTVPLVMYGGGERIIIGETTFNPTGFIRDVVDPQMREAILDKLDAGETEFTLEPVFERAPRDSTLDEPELDMPVSPPDNRLEEMDVDGGAP